MSLTDLRLFVDFDFDFEAWERDSWADAGTAKRHVLRELIAPLWSGKEQVQQNVA